MNMQKLNEFFPWSESSDNTGQFIVCYDNNSGSGEFSFIYYLLKLLKEDVKVELVSCNHDRAHYESILRKNVLLTIVLIVTSNISNQCRFVAESGFK